MKKFLLSLCMLSPLLSLGQQYDPEQFIIKPIAPEYDAVGSLHRKFFGENYRSLWATPVKLRILNIQKEQGGLKILKLGGGNQTKSIRFVDPKGKEWVLRTIQKYPDRALPEGLKATIARDIVQDQVSTGHPFGALIVPPLADALQIPHANPEIVYVGDDPGLGEYRQEFANAAYLFEEREPLQFEDTDNTEKVQTELQEDNDHVADQRLTLRARLLDFVIGDWDRHEDNWRWGDEKKGGVTTYIPIPRDRDKVFYKTSGILPWVLSHQWLKANLQPYSPGIRDVKTWNFNNRYFDRYFLTDLNEADWRKEIKYVQQQLCPELVKRALSLLPPEIRSQNEAEISTNLNGRIQQLEQIALEYYRFLAKTVDIPASDKREQFSINHQANGDLELRIENIKKDSTLGRSIFHRTFKADETEEIRLYGFGGDDIFDVKGQASAPIRLRFVGGAGNDRFNIAESLKGGKKPFVYDRQDEQNQVPSRSYAKLRLANDTVVNSFNKRSFVFDQLGPLFRLNYSIDRGLQPGVGLIYQKQGFRKTPYAFHNEFWVNYSTGRQAFHLTYEGDFKEAIGKNDLKIDVDYLGPNNQSNFFGLGNDTRFEDDEPREISFYRNRYDYLNADIKLKREVVKNLTLEGGISTEFYSSKSSRNAEHFLGEYDRLNPAQDVFNNRFYAGLIGLITYDTRDNEAIPTKGIYWQTAISGKQQVAEAQDRYGYLRSEFRFYLNPGNSGLVIANRIGAGTTFGDPTFFQRMQLGGARNLRGFHSNRFSGKSAVYYNLDLRLKLFDFTSYITPGEVGMIAFNDVGRVWEPGESSSTWHDGFGGGLYVRPAELILIQGTVGFSREGALPYISVGFSF
ncbi:BamA/TamA family outer membrane protein [Pedobacter sp. SAFR-022]|uniref:BamA/TamA family outer membrane protein n=1 Tax=Pedobacter sp. SAFR-022 TaxID=3436861 RepID=UPI003F7F780C